MAASYYHVVFETSGQSHSWWNLSRERVITDLVIPFVNRQILPSSTKQGSAIFNPSLANYVFVLRTPNELEGTTDNPPSELGKPDFVKEHNCTQEILDEIRVSSASEPSRSLLQQAIATPKHQIFVIMKFGDPSLDSAYQGVIKPLAAEFGFEVLRIDEVQDSGRITDQILESIASSEIIVADLTDERPNCYYEAGYAHALGRELIFSVRRGTRVHFDLSGYRFIEWNTEMELREKLRARLRGRNTALRKGVPDTVDPRGPK